MRASDFINKFKTGQLGKKKQHSSYRVIDGKHCQLLVRSTKEDGVPKGNELIGVYFINDICIFHNNFNWLQRTVRNPVWTPIPIITREILKEDDPCLIESGVIEYDTKNLLIELGETPWLFEYDPNYTPHRWLYWDWEYNTGTQISRRVETIEEAKKDINSFNNPIRIRLPIR